MTWKELTEEVSALSSTITFSPDYIVGIVRGGIVPARLLSRNLNVKDMYCLTVKKVGDERKVTSDILEDLTNKKILLVEDMLETGKSLVVAKQYLEKKGASVKIACLYSMPHSQVSPDFFLREIINVVSFPWE